jgi:MFS family permease
LAAIGLLSLFAGLATPRRPLKSSVAAHHPLAGYLPLLRKRIIVYTMLCAYLSALPFSLTMSFYPLLLTEFGHGEGESGLLLSLRAVGSIFASLLAARFVRSGARTLWPVNCGLAVAAAVGLVPTVNHAAPIAFWMLVVGAATAAMTLYFQITISEASASAERGSALALGGLGWSVSHLSTPLLMGFLADRYGLIAGFYVLGAFALACALLIAATRRWAFRAA